jgi:RNA polymerase sigma-70 factor, ECF subfamily
MRRIDAKVRNVHFPQRAGEPFGGRRRSSCVVVIRYRRPGPSDRGDEQRMTLLFDQHGGPLLAYALQLTAGDRQRAEDVVQETLLRAWRHPEALTPERGSARAWLRTVARNIAFDDYRARQARPREVGIELADRIPEAGDDAIDRALEAWIVAEALESLSEAHRQVLIETFYRGGSVAEASVALGVPPGTVKSRTFYALRALRAALVERGVLS